MGRKNSREVTVGFNASGAARAASQGYVVLIVDVIDMSTSLEAALDGGAAFIFGASPDKTKAPVQVNPFRIGYIAGQKAQELESEVVIITEPRWGTKTQRSNNCTNVLRGIKDAGACVLDIVPNLGAEVIKTIDFQNKIVVCVSDTGGVAYDAAFQFHEKVITGTIARTPKMKGNQPALKAVQRAIDLAQGENIAVIAASSNSLEDVLGANYICQMIINLGYLNA